MNRRFARCVVAITAITFVASCATLPPEGTALTDVKVVETRTVSFYDPSEGQWKELGSVDQNLTAALGTRRAEGTFDLPSDVPEGRFRITLKVTALGKTDAASQEITVRKG